VEYTVTVASAGNYKTDQVWARWVAGDAHTKLVVDGVAGSSLLLPNTLSASPSLGAATHSAQWYAVSDTRALVAGANTIRVELVDGTDWTGDMWKLAISSV
jgi:hypothetical protein